MVGVRRTALISLAFLLACNSIIGFGELEKVRKGEDGGVAGDDDDTTDDDDNPDTPDGGHDAPVTGPRCDPNKPFGAPVVISLDATAETKKAIMTRDELEIFYLRGASSPFELRHATRAARTDPWREPTTEVLSPSATELGSVVLGGLKLYYWNVSDQGTGLTTTALVTTRPQIGAGGFAPGKALAGVDRPVHAVENDDSIYWHASATIDGAGNMLIHRGTIQGTTIVGDSTLTDVHFYPSLDDHPVVPASELILYFASTRTGAGAQGSSDIWRATRASKAVPFTNPVNVTELNTDTLDVPTWVSDDDCVILLDRARHIQIAQRPL